MVESYKSQPIEERPSQKVGWGDYMKEVAIGLIPFVTAGAAIAFGKLTKQKIFPLDGSPDLLTKGWMMLTNKTLRNTQAIDRDIQQTEWVWWLTAGQRTPEDKLLVSKHWFNGVKGFEFGAIPVLFHLWGKKEKQRLDLTSTYESLKDINTLKPSDADLAAENASLKQQLEFVHTHPQTSVHVATSNHQGILHAPTLERQA